MSKFKRRFSKDEFSHELAEHLRALKPADLQAPKKLEANAARKAQHYSAAVAALDRAADRIRQMAAANPELQQEADEAVKEINSAIDTYGEASLYGNRSWNDS